ncbi:MAG: hypothetical protein AABZ33_04870 [Chloroflexota bacterium]
MANQRTLASIVAGIVAILGLTVLIVVLADQRAPVDYPPDSPEAAVQGYLQAWDANDPAAAYAWFSADAQKQLAFADYRPVFAEVQRYTEGPDAARRSVFIAGTRGSGDRVTVNLTVEEVYGTGLSLNTYRSSRSVAVVREGTSWKLVEPLVWLDPAPLNKEPGAY